LDIKQNTHLFETTNPNRHWGCRLNDRITWNGFRAIMLQNELLQIVVLLDKGAEIIQFLYKPLDLDFLWRSENPLRDPSRFVPTGGSPVAPFFDHWSGGWFEVVPNGGPGCEYKGASLGFFAETINVPWEYRILEDHPERVSLGLWVKTYRTPFLLQKTLTLETGKPALLIEERLTNEGQEPIEFMWGHHPVVGAPFLDESCYVSAPDCQVEVMHAEDGPDHRMGLHQVERWPIIKDRHGQPLDLRHIPPPAARTMDNCYLRDFKEGWIAVTNRNQGAGFGLAWDADVFRYVWIWQAFGGGIGYPWYGRTYSLALEPWTSYPCAGLAEAVQRGTAARLEAGESLTAWMTAVAYTDVDVVRQITREGQVLG
jgi:galactose mutarotase-like enzyme